MTAMVWDPNTKENNNQIWIEMVQRCTCQASCMAIWNYVTERRAVLTEMLEQLEILADHDLTTETSGQSNLSVPI